MVGHGTHIHQKGAVVLTLPEKKQIKNQSSQLGENKKPWGKRNIEKLGVGKMGMGMG